MKFFARLKAERMIRKADRLSRSGKPAQALQVFDDALTRDAENVELLLQKAWLLTELKRLDESKKVLKTAMELSPEHAVLWMIQGEIHHLEGQYDAAIASLQHSLELSGDNIRVEYLLGRAFVAKGDFDQAARYFESSIKYDKLLVQSRLLAMAERYLFEQRRSGL